MKKIQLTRGGARMRRLLLVAAMAMSLGLVAGPAVAANPHVVKGPDVSLSGNTLTVAASIAGLGNITTVDFSLTGIVNVYSRCYNRGGNKPQADNKQETINVQATGTFPVRNGRTNVSFAISPVSTLRCPGNQVVKIESVSWDLWLNGPGISVHIVGP